MGRENQQMYGLHSPIFAEPNTSWMLMEWQVIVHGPTRAAAICGWWLLLETRAMMTLTSAALLMVRVPLPPRYTRDKKHSCFAYAVWNWTDSYIIYDKRMNKKCFRKQYRNSGHAKSTMHIVSGIVGPGQCDSSNCIETIVRRLLCVLLHSFRQWLIGQFGMVGYELARVEKILTW